MEKVRCRSCSGSGKILGGGMIQKDCDSCFGSGSVEDMSDIKIDRRSKSYKGAIKKIMSLDKDMTEDSAVKIFEEEYGKI